MKLKGINNGSKKTKNLIKREFAELLEEKKEIQYITVTELVKRANLTRGAFYSHYDNIYEVAVEMQNEILEKIFPTNELHITKKQELYYYIDSIFKYLEDNKKIYSQVLASNDPLIFTDLLNKKITNTLTKTLSPTINHLDILLFTNGIINIIIQYFRGEIKESFPEICSYVKKISSYLFFDERN